MKLSLVVVIVVVSYFAENAKTSEKPAKFQKMFPYNSEQFYLTNYNDVISTLQHHSEQNKGQGKEAGMQRQPVIHGKVETLPAFKKGLKDLRCCDGDAVTLECIVDGSEEAEVRWERGGRLLHLGGDISADFDGTTARLTISQVYPEDEGEYSCVAYNDLGSVVTSAVLVVDVPEEKENLLSRQLKKPTGLISNCSTPRSTPRTTPSRSLSPYARALSPRSIERPKRHKVCAPKFYAVPHNRVAEEGETVRFQCAVAGHPTPWCTWDKNGTVVTPTSRLTITERDDLRVLEITEVTIEDAGLYRITLENDVGRVEASARLEVIGPHGYMTRIANARARSTSPRTSPGFRRRLVGSIGRLGSRITLACDVRASPSPIPSWYRDGELVVRSDKVIPTWDGHTAMLEFTSLERNDAGVYTCSVENELGRTQCSANLRVTETDDPITTNPPVFIQGLSDVTLEEGTSAEINVQIEGAEPLDIVWVRDGTEIPDCSDFQYVDYGDGRFGLRFADVFPQDAGQYLCEAFNQYGEAITEATINIKESFEVAAVTFSKKPSSLVVASGRKASFCTKVQCGTNSERPQICWAVGDKLVTSHNSSKFSVEEDGDVSILHIAAAGRNDAGQITVLARHSCDICKDAERLSTVTSCSCICEALPVATADLTVLPDNWASDGEADFTPPARIRSRSLSTSEIEVDLPKMLRTVVAYSADTPALLVRGPADANVLQGETVVLSATYCGQPEPLVRWLRGGQEMRDAGRMKIETGEGMSCLTISAITSDDSGKYVVSVENIHGADCHFASVAVEGPPDPPSGHPTVTSASPTSVCVTWSSPAFDGGHKLAGYIVEACAADEDNWTVVTRSSNALSANVTTLNQTQTYKFRVKAVNIHGESKPSQESEPFSNCQQTNGVVNGFIPKFVGIETGEDFKARYNVLEELGKGRYGVVHKVVDLNNGQKLAGKFIRCIKVADREKVKEEIEIMNSLRHPKLLQLAAAFESPREVVMVMEYISGGELFERVVADDFQLTERDCILFMKQICEGVAYMHSQQVVHLDLKPENIMCQTRTSHEIKLIDFGLAQRLDPDTPVRVLFGTPEFVPPEIINYEPIGVESDMWSVGVVCYVLLSGLSPFMGENDAETFANITRADFDFDDDAFDAISSDAKDFISSLLVQRKEKRLSATECLANKWMLSEHDQTMGVILSTDKLKKFIIRRKWQKTGNAIRALGRMANLSAASRRNSAASSTASSPRPSLSAARAALSIEETKLEELDEKNRGRMCSERSDSGISDCSAVTNTSATIYACDSITEEELPEEKTELEEEEEVEDEIKIQQDRKSSIEMENKVDDIRKKVENFSKNVYDMDKKLEKVGKQLGDIGQIKISQKKVEIKRIPSLKETSYESKTLMQPTASSMNKISNKIPPSSPTPRRSTRLTIPKSPELKTKSRSREHTPPKITNGICKINSSIPTARCTSTSGLSTSVPKSSEFLRLQQVFNSTPTKATPKVDGRPSGVTSEAPRTRTSPTFQKTVDFWKR